MSSSGYTGPLNPSPAEGESVIIIYGYVPSLALPIVGVITFAIVLLANVYYLFTKGKRYRAFHGLLGFGSLMECGGYAARIYSHYKPFMVIPFIMQYFLIVVAPVLFTAAIYLSLNLLVNGFPGAHRLLLLKPRVVLAIFVTADAITTIVQVAGAALIGVSESANARGEKPPLAPATANHILLAGLAVQTFSFIIFLTILGTALRRAYSQTLDSNTDDAREQATQSHVRSDTTVTYMRRMLWVILATSDLILLRTVFRLAETAQGLFSFASTHEYLFGILEYTPVIVALGIWSGFPPSRFVRSAQSLSGGDGDGSSRMNATSNSINQGEEPVGNSRRMEGNNKDSGKNPETNTADDSRREPFHTKA